MSLATPPRHSTVSRRILSLTALLALAASLPLAAIAQVIPAGTTGTAYSATTAGGSYVLNAGDTRTFTGASEAVTFGGATGPFTLTINGSLISTSATANTRGVRGANNNVTFNLTVGGSGLIQAFGDDAIQARNGTFNVTNNGTIYSGSNIGSTPVTAIATGQALDLANATGGTVWNVGLIRADGHDAVRLGSNMTMTNAGTGIVRTNGVVNDNSANNVFNAPPNNSVAQTFSANDGVSFENGTNSSLINFGLITGSRHGAETDTGATNISVYNNSGGVIIGRNGSGFGSDATSAVVSNITVHNSGVIRGGFAGPGNVIDRTGNASFTQDGDGDGVDIDGAGTVNNYAGGVILGTGYNGGPASGYDSSGRANTADGISMGGGIINNSGVIRGDVGIVVNNDTNASRSGVAATTITNSNTIEGTNGYAIRLENKLGDARDNDTIINTGEIGGGGFIPNPAATITIQNGTTDTNSTGTLDGVNYTGTGSARFIKGDGSAIQMGEGNDTLTNTGTIIGNTGRAINMEGGNDTVHFNGGNISGSINGGTGTNTLNLGAGVSHGSATQNFQNVNVATGTATLAGIVSGTTLIKGGAGTLNLTAANTYTAGTTVAAGTLLVNNTLGSATGTGAVTVDSGAIIGGGGLLSGLVIVNGIVAPGNSIGTLSVDDTVIWNGSAGNEWQFELGAGNTADLLAVTGDFTKGTGSNFTFNFLNSGTVGDFVLVDWTGLSTFLASDFTYINLAAGYTGSFALNGTQLEFTAIPEPSTTAAMLGTAALGFVAYLRRRRQAVT